MHGALLYRKVWVACNVRCPNEWCVCRYDVCIRVCLCVLYYSRCVYMVCVVGGVDTRSLHRRVLTVGDALLVWLSLLLLLLLLLIVGTAMLSRDTSILMMGND